MGEYIPKAPVNDEAKKHNEKLPEMGGVFNTVNLHTYHYAGNNPIKYLDPTGEYAEILKDGNDITIIIPVEYSKGTTDNQKEMFKNATERYWSGEYGNRNITLKVEERNKGERNKITFKNEKGVSNVVNSSKMTLFNEETDSEKEWVIAHEVGHLMNLEDKYIERKNEDGTRKTTPEKGWEKNIMAQFWGKPDERNINNKKGHIYENENNNNFCYINLF